MPNYRVYTLDVEGRIIAVELVTCANDAEALEYAARLWRDDKAPIEVWELARCVGRVDGKSPT
jgi:hypothetical protein